MVLLSHSLSSVHPFFVSTYEEIFISRLIAQGLYSYDPYSKKLRNEIVQKQETSSDGRIWTFHLKHGRELSTGRKLNAASVVATYKHFMQNISRRKLFANVKKITAMSEYVVRMYLHQPDYELNALLGGKYGPGILLNAGNNKRVAGYGPYTLKYFSSNKIILVRNPHYKDGYVETEKIIFRVVPDEQTRYKMLVNREADIGILQEPQNIIRATANPFLRVERNIHPEKLLVIGNRYPFNKPEIRQAIFGHSLSRNKIAHVVYSGLAEPEVNVYPAFSLNYRKQEYLALYNPEDAANVLRSQNAGNIRFTLFAPIHIPFLKTGLELWKKELEKSGIKMRILYLDQQEKIYYHLNQENYQAAFISSRLWMVHPRDILQYYEIFNNPKAQKELFPEEALQLIEKALQTKSSSKRNLHYFNAMKKITQLSRIMGVITLPSYAAASNKVQNFVDFQRGRLERVRVYQ